MLIRLIVPGEHARIEDLNVSLDAVLDRHGISHGTRGDARLIVEELASNAISHGMPGEADIGQHELSVAVSRHDDLLKLVFRDDGAPFDPTASPEPDLDSDIIDRPVGGLGLYLIRQIAEEMLYERVDDTNVLHVTLRTPLPETSS